MPGGEASELGEAEMVRLVIAGVSLRLKLGLRCNPQWVNPPQMVFCSTTITCFSSCYHLNTLFASNVK